MVEGTSMYVRILGIRGASGVCVSDRRQRVRVTERSGGVEGCGDAACRIPFSPSREAIEFASCRALVCEPRDRMSRAGIAFPAIPAVRTRHRPGDIETAGRDEHARPRPYRVAKPVAHDCFDASLL